MFVCIVILVGMGIILGLLRMFFEVVFFVDVYEWGFYK